LSKDAKAWNGVPLQSCSIDAPSWHASLDRSLHVAQRVRTEGWPAVQEGRCHAMAAGAGDVIVRDGLGKRFGAKVESQILSRWRPGRDSNP
jgi:hypothetical protein